MYKTYKLLTLTLNTKGGEAQEIESLTKEVEGKLVPCTKAESELKMASKISTVGGNPATQSIKCFLITPEGNISKIDEIIKNAPIVEE